MKKCFLLFVILFALSAKVNAWGFFCHRLINKHAVFLLPPEMLGFYKKHIDYIIQHSIDPDKRSRLDPKEAVKHYMDIDHYGVSPFDSVPKKWKDAIAKYSEDTLMAHGILPWNIDKMTYRLSEAFKEGNVDDILWISANLGHYVGDAHVPLHNTHNYDGRIWYQKGVHAFWESRIPEQFADDWDYFIGRAQYLNKPLESAWKWVELSNHQSDTVLNLYDSLLRFYPQSEIYSVDERGGIVKKMLSKEFSLAFEKQSANMVYRKLRLSIFHVASIWYTAWVNAGQPDLVSLEDKTISEQRKKEDDEMEYLWKHGKPKGRPNPEDEQE